MLKLKLLKVLLVLGACLSGAAVMADTGMNGSGPGGMLPSSARRCEQIGWSTTRNGPRQCVAGYRNDDNRFRRDVRRYDLRNCTIIRDHSGDRFYYCDLGFQRHPRHRNCEQIGWSTVNNGLRQCVAGYRNNDSRYYQDVRRYSLHDCMIYRDHSGDRFYYCDL
jgi:hypothetical protein